MTDIEIARGAHKQKITDVASLIGLEEKDLILYGEDKAKIILNHGKRNGNLILVTAINPTPYGEGKTTVSIALTDALRKIKKDAIAVLRQPSMGPVFGMKGGATGGGYSQLIPMEDINLHFTGDFHAITSANNLLCAAIDNHIYQGNQLDIQEVLFKRCLDVNDRALRDSFDITAASEIMALFCLATSLKDLEKKLGNIIIGTNSKGDYIYAKELHIEGALTVILKDAFYPNLVQTLENTPVIVHGGPFANIAHGCNSIVATKLGLSLSDYVVTEAGFGADLGAEKFLDIKCRKAGLTPNAIVLVATIKALKYNGGVIKEDILKEDTNSLQKGICNLDAHIRNLKKYGVPLVVCLNRYSTDTEKEITIVENYCKEQNVSFAISNGYSKGGEGATELAKEVVMACTKKNDFHFLYEDSLSIQEKIKKICIEIYHAKDIEYSKEAQEKIKKLSENNLSFLPICVAKTQYSLSDDAKKLGSPEDYTIHVRDIVCYHGAGFITVLLGKIMKMPGLPKVPNYEAITLNKDEEIEGIF